MSGYAVAPGALFGSFPGLQWGTSLDAGQLTSDIAAATRISSITVLASTGGVSASEVWNTAVSSASDSAPTTTVVIQTTLTASASDSAHHILPEDAVVSISVRDSEDPGHGVWPPRTRDWYCGTVGAGSGTCTGMCVAQTTSASVDDSNTIPTTLPVDSEGGISECVAEGVEVPSPQGGRRSRGGSGGSSGSPGTTRLPLAGYNLKPTTTGEAKDVEAPPVDGTTTGTSTSTSMPITAAETTATATPVPSRHTPPASSEATSDSDGSEPGEIRTCDIRDVQTAPGESTATSPASSMTAVATGGIS
ncbi:hypothetical protein DL763_005958 [Monosporascus cannonballus]|nr:hypothetical protein DL763_005958 [Monosporascus cannonballus]